MGIALFRTQIVIDDEYIRRLVYLTQIIIISVDWDVCLGRLKSLLSLSSTTTTTTTMSFHSKSSFVKKKHALWWSRRGKSRRRRRRRRRRSAGRETRRRGETTTFACARWTGVTPISMASKMQQQTQKRMALFGHNKTTVRKSIFIYTYKTIFTLSFLSSRSVVDTRAAGCNTLGLDDLCN